MPDEQQPTSSFLKRSPPVGPPAQIFTGTMLGSVSPVLQTVFHALVGYTQIVSIAWIKTQVRLRMGCVSVIQENMSSTKASSPCAKPAQLNVNCAMEARPVTARNAPRTSCSFRLVLPHKPAPQLALNLHFLILFRDHEWIVTLPVVHVLESDKKND